MDHGLPTPDGHAQGWRLITDDARPERAWIDATGASPALLLVRDTQQDWWAITPECRICGATLLDVLRSATTAGGLDELHCANCGTAHGPEIDDCHCVALMVVDEEIYIAPERS
jgi:hypothetical protein